MFKAAIFSILLSTLTLARPAMAAETPEIGPPQTWIEPAPAALQPMKTAVGSPFASLVQDAQYRFDAQGFDFYEATKVKVQTAQGLQAMSTVGLSWSPATDLLTVHRIQILRGDRVIDVLPKAGAFTIARREEKLDSEGRLDGILTAIVKIDGLQVGDVLDMSYTIRRNDPLFKNRVDQVTGIQDLVPVRYDRIRMSWPEADSVHWRAAGGMPQPRVASEVGVTTAEIIAENVTPLIKPQGAPPRFQRGREFSVSNYQDWAAVSAAMTPLYSAAAQLQPNSPLKAEAAIIAAATPDPQRRAAAALALVQDKIRYLAQTLGEGGYKPAAADDTWSRRYGDCKAKTTMLLALLNELGIKAEPALVSTVLGDDLNDRLPGLAVFNHVFVHAVIDGRDYWLDGTRSGDLSLASLSTPNVGYVLPVRASGATLVHLTPEPLNQPGVSYAVHLDAAKGLLAPAAAHIEVTFRGDSAKVMRIAINNLAPADLDRALRDYWHQNYDYITVTASKAMFDSDTGEARLTLDGEAKLDWSGGYEPDGASLGWKFDPVRDPAAIHPDAPFAVAYPLFTEHEVTLTLPNHGLGFKIWGDNIDRKLAGYALVRQASISGGVFHMRTSQSAFTPEISYAQAKADADPLTTMSKTTLRITAPDEAKLSDQDLTVWMAQEPSSADAYLARGNALMNAHRFQEAIGDFDRSLKLNSNSAIGFGDRALAHAWLGQAKEALADADAGEALDQREPTLYRARGVVAEHRGDWPDAIANFTRSIDLQPDTFGYRHRADAYAATKDFPRALRDLDSALKLDPNDPWPHVTKARVYWLQKEPDKARAEIDAVKSAAARDDQLRANRLSLLLQLGDRTAARSEADAEVKAHPTAANFLQRITTRDSDDLAGAEADAAAAHAADPKAVLPMRYLAAYRLKAKDYGAANAWIEQALALEPSDVHIRTQRAIVLWRLGRLDAARADINVVRNAAKGDAQRLNNLCYDQATADIDLTVALADCDASIALARTAATLDSRGFVLLRLGRNQEARSAFDDALALSPDLADSLYGRSLVESRLGDMAAAGKDRAAALAKNPKVAATFVEYGVSQ
jgi:tetratricopeptide (TPR) repeat protein